MAVSVTESPARTACTGSQSACGGRARSCEGQCCGPYRRVYRLGRLCAVVPCGCRRAGGCNERDADLEGGIAALAERRQADAADLGIYKVSEEGHHPLPSPPSPCQPAHAILCPCVYAYSTRSTIVSDILAGAATTTPHVIAGACPQPVEPRSW